MKISNSDLKIIFISPFFAPLANAEAFCNGKLLNQLLKYDVTTHVIAVDYKEHQKFSYDQSIVWDPLQDVTTRIPPHGHTKKILSYFLGFRYGIIDWSRWVNAVVQQVEKLHRKFNYDIVCSRGLPNIAHIAGYWVSKKLSIKWMANLNDPWDLEGSHLKPQDRHLRKTTPLTLQYDKWLPIILKNADLITFPCERLAKYHNRIYDFSSRSRTIPHIGYTGYNANQNGQFRLLHAGNLGAGESTRKGAPQYLLKGIKQFIDKNPGSKKHFKLILVGREDPATLKMIDGYGLSRYVEFTGWVSYEKSLEYIGSSSVCVLIEGIMPEGIFLPSKLADYIVSKKPVLALSPDVGTVADLEGHTGIVRVTTDNESDIVDKIEHLYHAFQQDTLRQLEPSAELVQLFDSDNVATQFIREARKLVNSSN